MFCHMFAFAHALYMSLYVLSHLTVPAIMISPMATCVRINLGMEPGNGIWNGTWEWNMGDLLNLERKK